MDQNINLEEIVLKYRPVVSFKVKKSLGSRTPDWEDVVEEILAQVIGAVQKGEFRGDSSIGTFIYTITSRRIVDYIRQKTRILSQAPEPAHLPDPHDSLEQAERSEHMAKAIQGLNEKYRQALYLYYYQELSREEVGQRLGISPARVSERINYAHKLLRKIMKKEIPFLARRDD
jgi:RNA polymerase sigma-70 factor (ECF subfamily)